VEEAGGNGGGREWKRGEGVNSAWKSSPKTEKRPQLDWTKTAKDWTCSLSLSYLRLQDRKKTG
jgi:hypothetical protein